MMCLGRVFVKSTGLSFMRVWESRRNSKDRPDARRVPQKLVLVSIQLLEMDEALSHQYALPAANNV
jgi:hypothetical protein